MIEQLVARTDPAYQQWLASIADDVLAANDTVLMYCRDTLLERNTTYEVGEYLPGYLMIGGDGGGHGFLLRCDTQAGPVYRAGLGALFEDDLDAIAATFTAWQRSGFALPPE